ncbi:class I SAM-dependent methyltransferase [Clostridium sp. 'deep sea']|uniref:class I SAM-dependent methyltransferase n=1 Tax=Clostridium sp. 'deep sea' TaxID=2779445 RepID=UPI0018964FAE|nr:class I SAM-dependent methyltransferase [Clostridium sp. 'deep sea']QOR35163.1 class I SAM-dependent methyltransferase [Clostridium sp. 'deep sea']
MQLNYRNKDNMIKEYTETKEWLDKAIDQPVEEIRTFFNKRSDGYDKLRMDEFWDDYKIIPNYLPNKFNTMLNIGCGSGFEFNFIFNKYPNINVTGIDISNAMLDKFRQKFIDKNIELINADYFKYPFEKNQYDVVLSVQTLHHFKYDKKKEIYGKIYHATKDNGFYYELDYMAQDEEYEKICLEYSEKRRKKYNIPDDVFVHIDIPLTIKHQIELLSYVGFTRVEVLNKPFLNSNTVFLKASK